MYEHYQHRDGLRKQRCEKVICYVAGRIEDKWQKQRHPELAIKAEKLPFAFPEELSSCYRTAVKHNAHVEGNNTRCREGGRPRTPRKHPPHKLAVKVLPVRCALLHRAGHTDQKAGAVALSPPGHQKKRCLYER